MRMSRTLCIIPDRFVKRKGVPLDSYAKFYTPDEARRLLSTAANGKATHHELLLPVAASHPQRHTSRSSNSKIYIDIDLNRDDPSKDLSTQEIDDASARIAGQLDKLVRALHTRALFARAHVDASEISYVMATRHRRKKLSFRVFIQGVYVRHYHEIPVLLKSLLPDDRDREHWDMAPYKPKGEQLLACVNCFKTREDFDDPQCRLVPYSLGSAATELDVLMYTAQHVPEDWICLPVSTEDDATTTCLFDYAKASTAAASMSKKAALQQQPPHDFGFIMAILKCLDATWYGRNSYANWLKVGMALANRYNEKLALLGGIIEVFEGHTIDEEMHVQAWITFSQQASEYAADCEQACRDKWATFGDYTGPKISLGTLCAAARACDEAAYKAAVEALRGRVATTPPSSNAVVMSRHKPDHTARDTELFIHAMLVEKWPERFANLNPDTFSVTKVSGPSVKPGAKAAAAASSHGGMHVLQFQDSTSGILGKVYPDYYVSVLVGENDDEELLGELAPGLKISEIQRVRPDNIGAEWTFDYSRHATIDQSELRHKAEGTNDLTRIMIHGPYTSEPWVEVVSTRGAHHTVGDRQAQWLLKMISARAMKHAGSVLGPRARNIFNVTFNQVANTINNYYGVAPPAAEMRADSELADAWLTFLKACGPEDEAGRYKVVSIDDKHFYYYSEETGVWLKSSSIDKVSNHMLDGMESVHGGAFMASLSPAERKYLRGTRGGALTLRRALNKITDLHFEKRLDVDTNLLPFSNGVVDLRTGDFRPLRWNDYITATIGYAYEEHPPQEHVELVDKFFAEVLPVPEERELVLRMIGTALLGMPVNKKFLVLQDERGGNNGKSMVIKAFEAAFGAFSMGNQNSFLGASSSNNANGHESNTLSYRGKRLAIFDETQASMQFDLAKLKNLTGGAPTIAARAASSAHVTEFQWSAFILIACNQGCLPRVDSTDTAFVNRMVTVPMRAKFNDAEAAAGVKWTYPMDVDMGSKLKAARMATMHVLLQALRRHYAAGNKFDDLPQGCLDLRARIVKESDPVLDLVHSIIEKYVDFNLTRTDEQRGKKVLAYVRRKDLQDLIVANDADGVTKRCLVKDIKKRMDTVMTSHGRRLVEDTTVDGRAVTNVYTNCVLRESNVNDD